MSSRRSATLSDYTVDVPTQEVGLEILLWLIRQGGNDPAILSAARAIKTSCTDRDDECEVEAVFNAVKYGDSKVSWLANGFQYVSDPRCFDTYATAGAIVKMCQQGSYAGDCDEACVLTGSLLTALGFNVGARAWGPSKSQDGDYTHVYCVVAIPKHNWPGLPYTGTAVDTTERDMNPGDELWPAQGHVMQAWLSRWQPSAACIAALRKLGIRG